MTSKEEIKRCPFCGGQAGKIRLTSFDAGYKIICLKGCVRSKKHYDEKNTTESWNTRPIEDALREENQRLREMLRVTLNYLDVRRLGGEIPSDFALEESFDIGKAKQILENVENG